MIDPMLSLALSVYSNPGVYAVLVGSGVSRSAGIPTGWEVVLDLIRKVAHLRGEDCEPDPAAWYTATFGHDPDYSKLLETLAHTPAERNQLLRNYFEPTQEEREQGLKLPTAAHRAIAHMVANGDIRVIITTNFDRLIEKAIEDAGVTPTVISSPDAISGAIPLTHSHCTVIKLHGDYLDARIRNTPGELARYSKAMDRLLDRVLDEFGLILCGWSADWDTALCAAVERTPSHRFSTFWTTRGKMGDVAQRLADLRRAQVLTIKDADTFFMELEEMVASLRDLNAPHPLSAKVASATMKRYLVDEKDRIRLHDLVTSAARDLKGELSDARFPVNGIPFPGTGIESRVRQYESLVDTIRALLITGCYWGEAYHDDMWVKAIEIIADQEFNRTGVNGWRQVSKYPILHLLYAGGISAVAAGNYHALAALLAATNTKSRIGDERVLLALYEAFTSKQIWALLPDLETRKTPLSDHLHSALREPLREVLSQDTWYDEAFDRFEYFLALIYADLDERGGVNLWGPVGRFSWRSMGEDNSITAQVEREATMVGSEWPPLQAGLFRRSLERFNTVKAAIDKIVSTLQWP